MTTRQRLNRDNHRGGFVLLAVLAVIVIAMSLSATWIKLLADHRETVRAAELQAQAVWVGESALTRMTARLLADDEYRDEAWHAMATPDGHEWLAEMTVQPVEGRPAQIKAKIKVIARDGETILLTRSLELILDRDRLRAIAARGVE